MRPIQEVVTLWTPLAMPLATALAFAATFALKPCMDNALCEPGFCAQNPSTAALTMTRTVCTPSTRLAFTSMQEPALLLASLEDTGSLQQGFELRTSAPSASRSWPSSRGALVCTMVLLAYTLWSTSCTSQNQTCQPGTPPLANAVPVVMLYRPSQGLGW